MSQLSEARSLITPNLEFSYYVSYRLCPLSIQNPALSVIVSVRFSSPQLEAMKGIKVTSGLYYLMAPICFIYSDLCTYFLFFHVHKLIMYFANSSSLMYIVEKTYIPVNILLKYGFLISFSFVPDVDILVLEGASVQLSKCWLVVTFRLLFYPQDYRDVEERIRTDKTENTCSVCSVNRYILELFDNYFCKHKV